jgi:hypothetical protein
MLLTKEDLSLLILDSDELRLREGKEEMFSRLVSSAYLRKSSTKLRVAWFF